jgi:thiol-disulfide isomerase/thioredoxin
MARKIISKTSSVFGKPSLFHIISIGVILVIGLWAYFNLFNKKSKSVHHLENFLEKETFHYDGLKNCEGSDKPFKLLFFFMETCPHCVDFKPVWQKFIEESKNEPYAKKLCIADISAENDNILTKYGVKSFPTVLLIRSDKTVISFEDNRTVEDLKSFVSHNVS